MDEFEKAERLRQCADVSYEEARDALKACGGDILDAMVYLERLGHRRNFGNASGPRPEGRADHRGADSYRGAGEYRRGTDSYRGAGEYRRGADSYLGAGEYRRGADSYLGAGEYRRETGYEGPTFLQSLGNLLGTAIRKSMENYLVVSYEGVVKFRISIFAFAILLMIFSAGLLIAMGVSLCFGVTYSFVGKDDLSRVNEVIGNAGNRATEWWSHYRYNPEIDALCRKYDEQERNDRNDRNDRK